MPSDPKLDLDDNTPWSEPAWYRTLDSPYYNESHRRLRDNIRKYHDTHILPHSLEWEEKGDVPREEALRYAQSGIPFDDVPIEYRPSHIPNLAGIPHQEMDVFHLLIRIDETARTEGGVSIALGGASTIVKSPDGKYYIVNGVKKWITGAPWATHMTTAVRTGADGSGARGISVLVIPMRSEGATTQKIYNSGQNAGGSSFVDMEDVRVPVENLIGEENKGFPIIMRNFNKERYVMAVQCNRKSRTCLALALSYALRRETFGQPLIQNQIIRRKLAELAHRVEAHWAWLEQLAFYINSAPLGWQSPRIASRIALLKVQGGQMLELAAREAQQIFGGAGYQKGGAGATVEQISRDLRMMVVGGGSEEIIADLAIRQEVSMLERKDKL